jgi:NAD(P)-dependent dehydrogenase (short-subunit alcohol dehydrogenase family)
VPLDEARRLFDVRFWGAVAAVRHAASRIRAGGSIVLTSGTVAVRPSAGAALVAGGAAAIEGLTRGLAVELAPVRVNAVRPGAVHTPMWDAIPEPRRSALLGALAERTITKTVGEPDQIAAAHLYLMDNRFVTGTVLTVDGGAVLF